MTTEMENIILNKEYFELTPEELESVSDLVQNAEEYDEMKWFLASTQEALAGDKIQATPQLKKKVMDHLHKDQASRKFWLNGVSVFLWPTDKEVYRRPAFQMSLAALLLIGFLMVYNTNLEVDNVAVNDTVTEKTTGTEENEDLVVSENEETSEAEDADGKLSALEDDEPSGDNLERALEAKKSEDGSGSGPKDGLFELDKVTSTDEEEEVDVPDYAMHDGFYEEPKVESELQPVEEKIVLEEEKEQTIISNANNNEGVSDESVAFADDADTETDLRTKSRNNSLKKEKQKDNKPANKLTVDKNEDAANTYKNDDQNGGDGEYAFSTTTTADTTSLNQPLGGATTTTGADERRDLGYYNTATVNGSYGVDNVQEIDAGQMNVKSTPELKKLFKTFK